MKAALGALRARQMSRAKGIPHERDFEGSEDRVVGNHLPRKCGIATFTTDLLAAVAAADSIPGSTRPHSEIAPWSIWISYSPDPRFWGESRLIKRPAPYHWDEVMK